MDKQVSDFDYELPRELIAQQPLKERTQSRMLVISRERQTFKDDLFRNFDQYTRPGDCLVLNNTKVFPARLHGRRNTLSGAEVEVFLIRQISDDGREWRALVRPGKRVKTGDKIHFAAGAAAEILTYGPFGERILRFEGTGSTQDLIDELGEVPLPPYIARKADTDDKARYQTVFAQARGSVAAPTAGLHFSEWMLEACRKAGAEIAHVTLHVGLGTFAPLRAERLDDIRLHEEHFAICEKDAQILRRARRLLCVGTTTVRTIESVLQHGPFRPVEGETSLFIHPGFNFRGTGGLLTNFHLPKSSLLMLVCAFGGTDLILAAYRHAVAEKYRFFSYGDCMLIE